MTDADPDDDTTASPAAATADAPTEDHPETSETDGATASDDGLAGLSPTGETPEGGVEGADARNAATDDGGRDLITYVEWAAFGILCLLALVATFRFYFAASEAIRVWFSRNFVPVFQAVFNLVILVLAALGISVLVRRLS